MDSILLPFARLADDGSSTPVTRPVAIEAPVAIEINGLGYAVMMATPADLEDFAHGFCHSERLIDAPADLVDIAEGDGLRLTGVLATHHHPDHVGGTMLGFTLGGVRELLEKTSVPVHVNAQELDWVANVTGIAPSELTGHEHSDKVTVGAFE